MKKMKKLHGVSIIIIIAFLSTIIVLFIAEASHKEQLRRETIIIQNGYSCYEAGVPAEANPYIGHKNRSDKAALWLKGWVNGHLANKTLKGEVYINR